MENEKIIQGIRIITENEPAATFYTIIHTERSFWGKPMVKVTEVKIEIREPL